MIRTFAVVAIAALVPAFVASADVTEGEYAYDLPNGKTAVGIAYYDPELATQANPAPGVLVIPEWWGQTDYPKMRARELAEQGYVAFVADMYGEQQTVSDPAAAQKLSSAAMETGLAALAKPGLDQMGGLLIVDKSKIAAIGFCFGGSTVVAMAGSDYGDELSAVVSLHGGLSGDAAPAGEYAGPPMMILHGGADPMVKPDAFGAFVQKSIEAGVPISVVSFPGTLHAFSNPGATQMAQQADMTGVIAYDEQATQVSLKAMNTFLQITLGGGNDADAASINRMEDAAEAMLE